MLVLHEALMRCSQCGVRLVQKMRPEEASAIERGRRPSRACDFCVTQTEWEFVEWRGNPPSSAVMTGRVDRILVIDDDESTVFLLRKVLEDEGTQLEIATDGREALKKMMSSDYSLIVCDLHMPQMDGKAFFRFVDEQCLESKSRIIFITGDTTPETKEFLESTGATYMFKPLSLMKFASTVREILES